MPGGTRSQPSTTTPPTLFSRTTTGVNGREPSRVKATSDVVTNSPPNACSTSSIHARAMASLSVSLAPTKSRVARASTSPPSAIHLRSTNRPEFRQPRSWANEPTTTTRGNEAGQVTQS